MAVVVAWTALQGFPPVFSDAGDALGSLPSQAAAIAVVAVWPRRRPAPLDISAPP